MAVSLTGIDKQGCYSLSGPLILMTSSLLKMAFLRWQEHFLSCSLLSPNCRTGWALGGGAPPTFQKYCSSHLKVLPLLVATSQHDAHCDWCHNVITIGITIAHHVYFREICQKTVTEWFRLSVDLAHDCIYPPTSLGKCFFVNLTKKVSDDVTLEAPGNNFWDCCLSHPFFLDMYPVILISVNLTNYILLCLLTSQSNCFSSTSL